MTQPSVDGGERCVVCGHEAEHHISPAIDLGLPYGDYCGDCAIDTNSGATIGHGVPYNHAFQPQPVDGGEAQDARDGVLESARRVYAEAIANAPDVHHKAAAWAQMRTLELYPPNEPTSPDPDEPLTFEDGAHNGYVAGYEQGRADLLHEVSELADYYENDAEVVERKDVVRSLRALAALGLVEGTK